MKSSFDSTFNASSVRNSTMPAPRLKLLPRCAGLLFVSLHADSSFFRPQAFRVNININISHTHLHHIPTGWVLGGYRVNYIVSVSVSYINFSRMIVYYNYFNIIDFSIVTNIIS